MVNIDAPNTGAPQYVNQLSINCHNREVDNNTTIVRDFNRPVKPMDKPSRQKINVS